MSGGSGLCHRELLHGRERLCRDILIRFGCGLRHCRGDLSNGEDGLCRVRDGLLRFEVGLCGFGGGFPSDRGSLSHCRLRRGGCGLRWFDCGLCHFRLRCGGGGSR